MAKVWYRIPGESGCCVEGTWDDLSSDWNAWNDKEGFIMHSFDGSKTYLIRGEVSNLDSNTYKVAERGTNSSNLSDPSKSYDQAFTSALKALQKGS
ncbi:hypothetical protein KFE98_11490 [bacterium SCSIO 12741]|nr:hypothetical protein KFE98_11490 [bacterium SCSIO 12741]